MNSVSIIHSFIPACVLYFIPRLCIDHLLFFQHCNWHRDTAKQSRIRKEQLRCTEALWERRGVLLLRWRRLGFYPAGPRGHVNILNLERERDKGKILGRSVTWFDLQSPKGHTDCCVGSGLESARVGMERTVESWCSNLGERWQLPVDKSSSRWTLSSLQALRPLDCVILHKCLEALVPISLP